MWPVLPRGGGLRSPTSVWRLRLVRAAPAPDAATAMSAFCGLSLRVGSKRPCLLPYQGVPFLRLDHGDGLPRAVPVHGREQARSVQRMHPHGGVHKSRAFFAQVCVPLFPFFVGKAPPGGIARRVRMNACAFCELLYIACVGRVRTPPRHGAGSAPLPRSDPFSRCEINVALGAVWTLRAGWRDPATARRLSLVLPPANSLCCSLRQLQ